MRFVYVLENELRFQIEIVESILSIDPKIQIRLFPRLETFTEWLRFMMTTGPTAIASGGIPPPFVEQEAVPEAEENQLVAVISKVEYLGVNQLELIKKTQDLFIQRSLGFSPKLSRWRPAGVALLTIDQADGAQKFPGPRL